MSLELISIVGRIVGTLGAILVARTALRVHHRVWKEHKIDNHVFTEMHREQKMGIVGIVAMVAGLAVDVVVSVIMLL